MNLECLTNIIGLSETTCNCFDAGKPADFNTSTSGYYLDQLEGISLNMADCLDDCTDGSLWELLEASRKQATHDFSSEFFSFIQSSNRLARKPFKGFIGERKWNGTLPILGAWHGVRIGPCYDIRGGYIYIKNIGTVMNATVGAIEIQIWNNVDDAPLFTFDVTSTANKLQSNDVTGEDIKLPLWNEKCTGEDLEYYILFQPSGFSPFNGKINCNCGGKKYDYEDNWVDVDGVYGNDTSDLEAFSLDGFMNGLCLEVETGCELDDLICKNISSVSAGAIHRTIGRAIQYKAGVILVEKIMSSGAINRYTLLDNERLWGKRNHYRAEYQTRLQFLTDEVDISGNDCLACGADDIIAKRTIYI